jgi:hypothetical protein
MKAAHNAVLHEAGLPTEKTVSAATDGTPAVRGNTQDPTRLLKNNNGYPHFLLVQNISHTEHLNVQWRQF